MLKGVGFYTNSLEMLAERHKSLYSSLVKG